MHRCLFGSILIVYILVVLTKHTFFQESASVLPHAIVIFKAAEV